MAVKQLPKISNLPEPPDRLVGDQERFDVLTFNSLKAQKKMVNEDLNKTLIPALNEFAVDVNASVDAAALSERNAHDSEEVAKRKAGEASGSAGAAKVSEDNAKVSETNALASKNAAALSAESAESDRIAAEAARDEAQDLANVGYASESHAGLAKVDGKTTQSDAGGVITVKDVAIEGDLGDLASARGQIGDYRTKLPAGTDLNDIISSGTYIVYSGNCTNVPMNGMDGYYVLRVFGDATNPNAAVQKIYSRMGTAGPEWSRRRISDGTWQPWQQLVQTSYIGDGIKISRSKALADGTGGLCIISVPEMQGATISAAGTSGLVPPAAAGQQESFLTGGGEYKPALTKISDSVNLADSKMAASAKAVKAVYDRLEALRVSFLGVPRYWRSTTLPAGHVWANGDLALFSDWPELENLYRSGGLEGMLLSYDVPPSTIAQYCGRWRLNASSPTGLYVPNLSERFINSTINTNAFGTANTAGVPNIVGGWEDLHVPIVEVPAPGQSGAIIANGIAFANSSLSTGGTGYVWNGVNFDASRSSAVYGRSPTVMPASVNYPIIIYLGNHS